MTTKTPQIKRLFGLHSGCTLVMFDGEKYVDVSEGGFQEMLTQFYLTHPWKYFYVRLPSGASYPNDFVK